jgi:hypothetical protein
MKKLVVVGCPRSGTGYISKVLQSVGLDVGHEVVGRDGTSDWRLTVGALNGYDPILHQVRHPLEVIPSLMTIMPHSWQFMEKHTSLGKRTGDPWFMHPARIWLAWNKKASAVASFTYRVEDIETITDRLLPKVLLREPTSEERTRARNVPSNVNSRVHPQYRCHWQDIQMADKTLFDEMAELCAKVGYVENL